MNSGSECICATKPPTIPKRQNEHHWFEVEHAVTKDNADAEGSPVTPEPDLSAEMFEEPVEERMKLDEIPDE